MVIKRVHELIVAWTNRWRLRAEIVRRSTTLSFIYILLHFTHMSRSIKPYFTPVISEKSVFGKILLTVELTLFTIFLITLFT